MLDLGLARDLSDGHRLTRQGQIVGSANYLAPEVLLSTSARGGSTAGDIFAVGMVFFVMLTGRFPFDNERERDPMNQLLRRARYYKSQPQLPTPTMFDPLLPTSLDAVVSKALSPDPSTRYSDATDMLGALNQAETAVPRLDEPGLRDEIRRTGVFPVATGEPCPPTKVCRRLSQSPPPGPRNQTMLLYGVQPSPPKVEGLFVDDGTPTRPSDPPLGCEEPESASEEEHRSPAPPPARLQTDGSLPVSRSDQSLPRSPRRVLWVSAASCVIVIGCGAYWLFGHSAAQGEPLEAAASPGVVPATAPPELSKRIEVEAEMTLSGVPSQAEVRVNQQRIDPCCLRGIPGSALFLEVTVPGCEPVRMVVTLEPGKSLDLAPRLQSCATESQVTPSPVSGQQRARRRSATESRTRKRRRVNPLRNANGIADPWAR